MSFAIQERLDQMEALNKKLDMLLQSQLYAMPFKGHAIPFHWELQDTTLRIECPQLSAYIDKLEIQYENETVSFEPIPGQCTSRFSCKRASVPSLITLYLSTGTMVRPMGLLGVFLERTVGKVCMSPAYIQSVILQYAMEKSLFNDNVIHCDANLKKIFTREFLNLDTLDEKVSSMCEAIAPVEIALAGNSGGPLHSYRRVGDCVPCQYLVQSNGQHI